jgi:hypothetical protein
VKRVRFALWSPEALAASLRLAFLVGLIDAGNDNGRPRGRKGDDAAAR